MSKMLIYFSLFISLLFSSTDSSSIRDRTNENELVPFVNSRVDPLKRDSNSLKIVSDEPFIIQFQMPDSREKEPKRPLERDKKRKRPLKKRVSKIKPLKKKRRTRRELITIRAKTPEQKSNQSELPHAVNATEKVLNLTKNSINRTEILKALASFSKKNGAKQRKSEETKNVEKMKYNPPSRNLHNHDFSLSKQPPHVKMIYPSTPKPDQHQHKYTYKDLMADRERLEQKIKYIKNMLNVNDSATDDGVRVRRRSDSDKTANKIAKVFLTLSAVNGLHDRRKSKCRGDHEEEDNVRDVWEKERKSNPTGRSSSSNEERYKVKKWIEYMKNKRSSSKTCPCMTNEYDEESDAFPLEQKLPKGYFLRGRSSEESSESYSDPFYYSRDKLNNNNSKNRFEKYQDQENKLKASAKNGKKKLELPFQDLEVYRSRAKQILQNAEEILDRIKEEEEKRLQTPNILSQLKELTSRIHSDPRNNNENDLIRKIQKTLGWGVLGKPDKETGDSTFTDNVKSLILEPYEKAKALTDENTKKLSSYLLRNLGKLQDSSEEQEEGDEETARENSQVYFEQIPRKEEEKLVSASLAKENSEMKVNPEEGPKNYEDPLLIKLHSNDEVDKSNQEEIFKQRAEEMIKEQQKKVSEYNENHDSEEISQEIDNFDPKNEKVAKTEIKTAEKSESKKLLESEEVAETLQAKKKNDKEETEKLTNSDSTREIETEETKSTQDEVPTLKKIPADFIEKKKKLKMDETPRKENDKSEGYTARNMPAQEESKGEVKGTTKTDEKVGSDKLDSAESVQERINTEEQDKEENTKYKDASFPESGEQKLGQKKENEGEKQNPKEVENADTFINAQKINSKENSENRETENQKEKEETVSSSQLHNYDNESTEKSFETDENLKDKTKAVFDEISDETKSSEEATLQMQEKAETDSKEEDSAKVTAQDTVKELSDPSRDSEENVNLKQSLDKVSEQRQEELTEDKQDHPDAEMTQTGIQNENLKKESIPENGELLKSNRAENAESSLKSEEQSKEQEEKTGEDEDQNLRMENPDDETNHREDERKEGAEEGTGKEILANSEKLEKKQNENESESDSIEREDQENKDDVDTPLRAVSDKNSNEDSNESEKSVQESRESFDEATEDNDQLQSKKFENRGQETMDESINDETSWENGNKFENEKGDVTLEAKKVTEEMSNESFDKNEDINAGKTLNRENENNEETESNESHLRTALKKQDDEKDLDPEDVAQSPLGETISKEDGEKETNEKPIHSNEDKSEAFLESPKEEDEDLENSLKATNPDQNISDGDNDETKNTSEEIWDKIFSKDFQKNEESDKLNPLKSERLNDNSKSQEEDGKGDSNEITLEMSANQEGMEKLNEKVSETMSVVDSKDREEDRMNADDENEVTRLGKPQIENWDENQKDESLLNSQELTNEQTGDIVSKEAMLEKTSKENQSSKNSGEKEGDESLRASMNEQGQENPKVKDSQNEVFDEDQKSEEESSKEALSKDSQENIKELSDDEALKAAKQSEELEQNHGNAESDETNLKSILKYSDQQNTEVMDDDEVIKEANPKESEQGQNDFSESLRKVFDKQEQSAEMSDEKTERKLSENKNNQDEENSEETDDESTFARMAHPGEYESNKDTDQSNGHSSENDRQDISLESAVGRQKLERKEPNSNEIIQAENIEEDQEKEMMSGLGDGTPLKTKSSENTLDDEIDNEKTFLKSEKEERKDAAELVQAGKDESEETVREKNISDDLSNQIDQEIKENPLEFRNFGQINRKESEKNSEEESYETLGTERLSSERLSAEDENEPQLKEALFVNHDDSPDPQEEQDNSSASDFIQKTDSAKSDKLKVPKSIGNIMKALEGKEKDDITSFRNLNPDKIDHIIDKIDEAEQQNLRESLEDDCRKECACAEGIDTKSRDMGRYEIVKDFLYWMKDLKLNRVLSDD